MTDISWQELLGLVSAAVGFVLGAMWWLAKIILGQQRKLLDAQFAAQFARWELQATAQAMRISEIERRMGEETTATRQLRDELQRLRDEMPTRYVMRDDFLRFSAAFGEQMAALHRKIDDFIRGEYARRSE